jgi:hypothetical protein
METGREEARTPYGSGVPGSKPTIRDLSWPAFLALNPPKAIARNVFRTEDEQSEHLTKASQRFLRRHGIGRVYAPGLAP